jgi:hypothetical protein
VLRAWISILAELTVAGQVRLPSKHISILRTLPKVLLLSLAMLWSGDLSLAYEEPAYRVIKTYPAFELRQYDAYVVAETHVAGAFDDVGSQAFRRLFRYISADQRPQGKIAMTTPVIQQPIAAGENTGDDGSAPADTGSSYRFAFVMPAEYALDDLPKPDNVTIQLSSIPARLMAARRYSGTWSEERYRKNQQQLLEAVKTAGLKTLGAPIFARYNAPFSLWFLRRNEVLIEVAAP